MSTGSLKTSQEAIAYLGLDRPGALPGIHAERAVDSVRSNASEHGNPNPIKAGRVGHPAYPETPGSHPREFKSDFGRNRADARLQCEHLTQLGCR